MDSPFHYEVRITNVNQDNKGELDFDISTKSFKDIDPLVSRLRSFQFYEDFLAGVLENIGYKFESDRQCREVLNAYMFDKQRSIFNSGNDGCTLRKVFFGIAVFFVDDSGDAKPVKLSGDELTQSEELVEQLPNDPSFFKEQLIHGFGYYGSRYIHPNAVIENLWMEQMAYQSKGFDIDDKIITINFYDEELKEAESIEIIPTPFDWTGYDSAPKQESQEIPNISLEEILKDGETDQVEFKPSLLYNFRTKEAGISIKSIIGKAICGFLNARGGILFIGVDDNGNPQGLSYDYSLSKEKKPRDFFRLEFDEMLEHFLPQWVHDNVFGEFSMINGCEIFVVLIIPSNNEPVFFKGQNGKEFYFRRMASTKQLDIEQFYYYYKNHWGMKR